MKKILNIREATYIEDLNRASKLDPVKKLRLAVQLSDFCRYLQSKSSLKKGEK